MIVSIVAAIAIYIYLCKKDKFTFETCMKNIDVHQVSNY